MRQTTIQANTHSYRQADKLAGRHTYRQANIHIYGQAEKQAGSHTGRQANRQYIQVGMYTGKKADTHK